MNMNTNMTAAPQHLRCPHCQSAKLEVFIIIEKNYSFDLQLEYKDGMTKHKLKRQIKKAAKEQKGDAFDKSFKVEFLRCKDCRKFSNLEEILQGADS